MSTMRFARILCVLAFVGCGSESPPIQMALPPELVSVTAPTPVVAGTLIHAMGTADGTPSLVLTDPDSGATITLELDAGALRDELIFDVTADDIVEIGEGEHALVAKLTVGALASTPLDVTLDFQSELPVSLETVPDGEVHRNDVLVIRGGGLLAPSEGTVTANFEGTFTADSSSTPVTINASEPVLPAELNSRERGLLRLTTDLGGVGPGTFEGTVTLSSSPVDGSDTQSTATNVSFHFNLPEVIAITPTSASLGAYVTLQGAGFLGGADRPDETTSLRLTGMFTPRFGDAAPFDEEPVSEFVSGQAVRFTIETMVNDEGQLISSLFGAQRGLFRGTAEVVVGKGSEEVSSGPTEGGFVLGAVKQVVYLRFLPGFYDSLLHFGLGSAASAIEDGIKARIESIYTDYNVEVRLDEPDDFALYAIVEIGGPDPNGTGLFGYDNSPGKDIGNIRLYDEIGGLNAATQSDGSAGYGGVFVDSLLFFSTHPDLPGASQSLLDPEPLFDEIFDPVRSRPATLAEVRGEGDEERVAQVARAVRALSSIVGETTSHELGHSLGLAQPYGPSDAYHDEGDEEGCIMEPGSSRPLGERAAEPEYAETHFCYDEPDYLATILAR